MKKMIFKVRIDQKIFVGECELINIYKNTFVFNRFFDEKETKDIKKQIEKLKKEIHQNQDQKQKKVKRSKLHSLLKDRDFDFLHKEYFPFVIENVYQVLIDHFDTNNIKMIECIKRE